jgi:hypothetical protein
MHTARCKRQAGKHQLEALALSTAPHGVIVEHHTSSVSHMSYVTLSWLRASLSHRRCL